MSIIRHFTKKTPYLILFSYLLFTVFLSADNHRSLDPDKKIHHYVHDVWTTEDGLPYNSIWQIVQTKDGYIWLGTYNGLVRFDGVKFTNFNRSNTQVFRSSIIDDLATDGNNGIWLITRDNILISYINGEFKRHPLPENMPVSDLNCLYSDKKGFLWIGHQKGLLRFSKGNYENIPLPEKNTSILSITSDKNETIWLGSSGKGLFQYRDGKLVSAENTGSYKPDKIVSLCCAPDNTIWLLDFSKKNSLIRYSARQFHYIHKVDRHRALYADSNGTVWANMGGLSRVSSKGVENYTGINDTRVKTILEDREGNLWVGTYAGGLHRFKNGFIKVIGEADGMEHPFTWGLAVDKDGDIWAGADTGILYRLSGDLVKERYNLSEYFSKSDKNKPNYNIDTVFIREDGTVWIGTVTGLVSYKKEKLTFHEKTRGMNVITIYEKESDPGTLLIGTRNEGAFSYSEGNLRNILPGHGSLHVHYIISDPFNRDILWFGTNTGLIKKKRERLTVYTQADGLPGSRVDWIVFDNKGTMWLLGDGSGICRFKKGKFSTINTDNGLYDDIIFSILIDKLDRFWLTSDRGLFHVSKKDVEKYMDTGQGKVVSTVYGVEDGLKSEEFVGAQTSAIADNSGNFIYSTVKGIAIVDPYKKMGTPVTPPVFIEGVKINGKDYKIKNEEKLSPESRDLEFHYTALSYINPAKIRFKYKLEGYDERWIEAGTRRTAYYTKIPEGTYTFRVTASNNSGVWNDDGASVKFTRAPFFYETWWFITLAIASIVVLLTILFSRLLFMEKRRSDTLKKEIDERKRAQAALQNSERLLQLFFDNTPTVMYMKASDSRYQMVNKRFEELFDMKRDDIIGKKDEEIFPEPLACRFQKNDMEAISENGIIDREEELEYKGRQYYYISTKFPIFDIDSKLQAICGLSTDITARKIVEKELKLYQEDLEEIVLERTKELENAQKDALDNAHKAGMAEIVTDVLHNIGNVLTNVKTSSHTIEITLNNSGIDNLTKACDVLKENMSEINAFISADKGKKILQYIILSAEKLSEELDRIEENRKRLHEKINTISEVITAQQTNAATNYAIKEEVDLREIIQDTLKLDLIPLKSVGNAINEDFIKPPGVIVQKSKLVQIIINLIKNAGDAMSHLPEDERDLTISIDYDNESVYLKFTDNGKGIEKDSLVQIFYHGYTTKKEGHGFGLHSCATYMSDMDGEISAESDGPGKGATFTLKFQRVN